MLRLRRSLRGLDSVVLHSVDVYCNNTCNIFLTDRCSKLVRVVKKSLLARSQACCLALRVTGESRYQIKRRSEDIMSQPA